MEANDSSCLLSTHTGATFMSCAPVYTETSLTTVGAANTRSDPVCPYIVTYCG